MRATRTTIAVYVIATLMLADQLSKWWIRDIMQPPHVIPVTSFFNLVLSWNRGVTFGLFNTSTHHLMPFILTAVAVVMVIMLGRWLMRTSSTLVACALGAIIGGAVSNIIDRVRFGAVVDFLDFYYQHYHWYTFNIADAAIVSGVTLLLLDSLVEGR